MTEPTTPPEKVEETNTATEHEIQPASNLNNNTSGEQVAKTVKKESAKGPVLGAIAIVIAIALGAGLYYHGHQQALAQQAENNELSDQLTALHTEQAQEKLRINALINQQNKALSVTDQLQTSQSQQLKELEAKVAAISGSDAKNWLLAQADFLVKLAGLRLAEAERSATAARTALHAAHEEDPHADEKDHREPGDEDGRQKRRLLLGLAVDLNVALPELVHHPDVARIGELEFLAGLGRDDERTALDVDATDLARLGVLHELRVADRVARRGVGVFILAEHREEHQTDQRPDGDAAEDFVVQCMSPDGGAAVGPCAVIFLSLVRRPSPRKPFGIGKGVMGIF